MRADCIVGWDIGGAHLKAALIEHDGNLKRVLQLPCPLWQGVGHLQSALDSIARRLGITSSDLNVVTMTGEMADNFTNRENGVQSIINVMVDRFGVEQVMIFAGTDGFLAPRDACQATTQVASANWLASASWLSACMPDGLLIDIGSTTSDLIPFAKRSVIARGHTDQERLRYEELVYTGIVRTPVMTLAKRVPINGEWIGLMSEHFATSADVYRVLNKLPEDADQYPAVDAGDKTLIASERRLARMLGMDVEQGTTEVWYDVARYLQECQLNTLMDACTQILSRTELDHEAPLVGAGVGRFLVAMLADRLGRQYVDFNSIFDTALPENDMNPADCAPAVAVAALMQKKISGSLSLRSGGLV